MRNRQQKSAKQLKPPLLPKQGETLPSLEGPIEDRTVYAQLRLVQHDLSGQRAHSPTFDQILFEQVEMDSVHFNQARFLDSCFKTCNLANGELPKLECTRIEFHNCQLIGLQASEGKFQDVLFKGCLLSFAQFGFAAFQNVRFEDCDLSEANFYQANLPQITFTQCNLQQVDFSEARLHGVDLRGSQIDGMRLSSLELLKGAFVDQAQALAIVRGFGVNVDFL